MSTLLLLHGALGAAVQFDPLIGCLPSSVNIQALDFPLHGRNAHEVPFTIANFADDLIKRIEEMYTGKVSVFGYSMGGYVAMYAASLRPELFEGIMTLATKMHWSEAIADREKAMLDPDVMLQKIPAYTEQLQRMHHHMAWQDMVKQTASLMEDLGKSPFLDADRLRSIDVPVRLGIGDKDNMVSLEETIGVYRSLAKGSLYVLPHTKHPLDKVDPQMLAFQISRYFNY